MEKINYYRQELDLMDRLLRFVEHRQHLGLPSGLVSRIVQPATGKQLGLLKKLGIHPKWKVTKQEAHEMICHYRLILNSVNRR